MSIREEVTRNRRSESHVVESSVIQTGLENETGNKDGRKERGSDTDNQSRGKT